MTRDETVALFLECEAKRAEARTAALAEGKSRRGRDIAHEAAKAHWNAWADACSQSARRWKRRAAGMREKTIGMRTPKPISASASFSINSRYEEKEAEAAEEAAGGHDVKSIPVECQTLRRLRVSGSALFINAIFTGCRFVAQLRARPSKRDFRRRLVRQRYLHRCRLVRQRHLHGAPGSSAPPSGAMPRSPPPSSRATAYVRQRHLPARRLVRQRHLHRRRLVRQRHLRGRRLVRQRHLHGPRLVSRADLHQRRSFNKARFGPGRADFGLATFERVVQFDGAAFTGEADFNAVSESAPSAWRALNSKACRTSSRRISRKRRGLTMSWSRRRKATNF